MRSPGLLLLPIVLLAACSADPPPPEGATIVAPPPSVTIGSEGNATVAATAPTATPAVPAAPPTTGTTSALETPTSPLDEYLGPGRRASADDIDDERHERERRLHEEAIARCMVADGFEYVPFVPPMSFVAESQGSVQIVVGRSSAEPRGGMSDAEYAALYGYGISTTDADADGPAATAPGAPALDPNSAIVDGMSVPERVAYYQTLYGAAVSLTGEGRPNAEMPDDPTSCWAQASASVWGDEPTGPVQDDLVAAFGPLLEQVAALGDTVMADPRMVDALARWSSCLAAAGFPGYADINAPQTDVVSRARDLLGGSMDPSRADPGELAALRRFEIAIASADTACRDDYGATHAVVRSDVEMRFVEDHRAELEQYRDAAIASVGD